MEESDVVSEQKRHQGQTRRYVVAAVADLPPGTRRQVVLDGRAVAIFNVSGTFYGLRDVCPHRGAPLSRGTIVKGGLSASGPGVYAFDAERKLVKCPWHGWEYDLRTGQSWVDPIRSRVRPYRIDVESGAELAKAQTCGEAGELSGPAGPGPYVAETVKVVVENDYVVVEV